MFLCTKGIAAEGALGMGIKALSQCKYFSTCLDCNMPQTNEKKPSMLFEDTTRLPNLPFLDDTSKVRLEEKPF